MYIYEKYLLVIMHALATSPQFTSTSTLFTNLQQNVTIDAAPTTTTSDHRTNILSTAAVQFKPMMEITTTAHDILVRTTISAVSRDTTITNIRNITGYIIENDDADTSLSELQTLFITCTFTLLCLIAAVIVGFAVRLCWRKLKKSRHSEVYDGVLNKDISSAPLKGNLTLSTDELKTVESQFSSVAGTGEIDDVDLDGGSSPVLTYSGASNRTNHASANGSIITMTLKNNHLIVETEERNDIMENSRETTMKYSPSSHDGVFVVEVQQGVRRTPNYPNAATYSTPDEAPTQQPSVNHQRALVHHPPAGMLTNTEDESIFNNNDATPRSVSTGLSQSDLSESSNNFYRYGNQEGYNSGHYGYPTYTGYTIDTSMTASTSSLDYNGDNGDQIILSTTNLYKSSTPNQNQPRRDSNIFEPYLLSDVQEKERFRNETVKFNENKNIEQLVPNTNKLNVTNQTESTPIIENSIQSQQMDTTIKS